MGESELAMASLAKLGLMAEADVPEARGVEGAMAAIGVGATMAGVALLARAAFLLASASTRVKRNHTSQQNLTT